MVGDDGERKRERNIIIKGIKGVKEEKEELERKVEQIWKVLDVEVRIVEIKKLEKGRREWGELLRVKVGSEEERRQVLENKKKLRVAGGNLDREGFNMEGEKNKMEVKTNSG